MGDLISTRCDGGAAAGAAPCDCARTTCWPLSLVVCPALLTRTDDQAPNKPRRSSIVPSSGASLRICTSWAMMSRRSEEHTSELQSQSNLVCRLLLEKNKDLFVRGQRDLLRAATCCVHVL